MQFHQDTCKKSKSLVKVFRSLHIVLRHYVKISRAAAVQSKICPIKIDIPFIENNSTPLDYLHNTIYYYHKRYPPGLTIYSLFIWMRVVIVHPCLVKSWPRGSVKNSDSWETFYQLQTESFQLHTSKTELSPNGWNHHLLRRYKPVKRKLR